MRYQLRMSFTGDPVTSPSVDRSYAFVIGHDWVIGSNKMNRIILGETVQKLAFPMTTIPRMPTTPLPDLPFIPSEPALALPWLPASISSPASQARRIPIPILRDDFNWTHGSHNWQVGGSFKDILAHTTSAIDYNTVYAGLGGTTTGLDPSVVPSDTDPDTSFNYDQAFTFLLGRIGQVISDYNYNAQGKALPQLTGDQRYYRYYQTPALCAGFVEDNSQPHGHLWRDLSIFLRAV